MGAQIQKRKTTQATFEPFISLTALGTRGAMLLGWILSSEAGYPKDAVPMFGHFGFEHMPYTSAACRPQASYALPAPKER